MGERWSSLDAAAIMPQCRESQGSSDAGSDQSCPVLSAHQPLCWEVVRAQAPRDSQSWLSRGSRVLTPHQDMGSLSLGELEEQ